MTPHDVGTARGHECSHPFGIQDALEGFDIFFGQFSFQFPQDFFCHIIGFELTRPEFQVRLRSSPDR